MPQLTAEQIDARRLGVGGSDCDDLESAEPYGCEKSLFYDKTNVEPDHPRTETSEMRRGIDLEELVVQSYYVPITGRKVWKIGSRQHPKVPYFRSNVDRMIVGDPRGRGVLEIKCPNRIVYQRTLIDGPPERYISQVQWNMMVLNSSWAELVFFSIEPWGYLHVVPVERDEEWIQRLVGKAHAFWRRVENGPPPEPLPEIDYRCARCAWRTTCRGEELLALANNVDPKDEIPLDIALLPLAEKYQRAKSLSKQADELLEAAQLDIKGQMGDRVAARYGPDREQRIYYKPHSVDEIDVKALRAQFPEIAAQVTRKGVRRPLNVYPR